MVRQSVKELIMVPVIISLVITLLRLLGELMNWSPALFGRQAGGGLALVGIVWLVPILGIYFAWKLIQGGNQPGSILKTLGMALAGLAVIMVAGYVGGQLWGPTSTPSLIVVAIFSGVAIYLSKLGWKELYDTLLAYGFAARIPVVIVMLIAMLGDWGTHYDVVLDPSFPEMNVLLKWIVIGVIPQLTVWIAFTLIVGTIFALPVMALTGKKS